MIKYIISEFLSKLLVVLLVISGCFMDSPIIKLVMFIAAYAAIDYCSYIDYKYNHQNNPFINKFFKL